MACQEAMDSGKVKPLRLVSLGANSELVVQSVEHEFSDSYFANIGICSYTWGHDRVDWYDKETDLTWKISDKAERMCRASLEHYDRVWIDGLSMVQAWPDHIKCNMEFMGKLYFHGNVVTETCIGLQPEYCYRGWVQQEISFTNVLCVMKPLQDFVKSERGKEELEFINANKCVVKRSNGADYSAFKGRASSQKVLAEVIENMQLYLLSLQRVIQGRDDEDLDEIIEELWDDADSLDWYTENQNNEEAVLKATQHVYQAFNNLYNKIPVVVKLPRVIDKEKVLSGVLASFRSGFFRFNSDRIMASFSLAEYVLEMEGGELKELLDEFEPDPEGIHVDVVLANPGKWCTGLEPTARIRTLGLKHLTDKMVLLSQPPFNDYDQASQTSNLDKLFSVIHGVDISRFQKYEYVLGYHQGIKSPLGYEYELLLGLKDTSDPTAPVLGLITLHTTQCMSPFISNVIIGKTGEWMARAIALLNSSYHVHCLGATEHKITQSYNDITSKCSNTSLPSGDYFTPIFYALRYAEFSLGCLQNHATYNPTDGEQTLADKIPKTFYRGRDMEVLDAFNGVKEEWCVWGSEEWEHKEF